MVSVHGIFNHDSTNLSYNCHKLSEDMSAHMSKTWESFPSLQLISFDITLIYLLVADWPFSTIAAILQHWAHDSQTAREKLALVHTSFLLHSLRLEWDN